MGRVTNSILSGTSGRTGRIIIANVHGVEISRIRPLKRNTITEPQIAHRDLFRFAVAFLGLYKSFARLFFGKRKGLVTPYNQAQANVMESIRLGSGDVVINYNKVLISKGTLLDMIPGSISAGAAQAITVTWTNNAPPASTNESDLCTVFVYVPSRRDGQLFSGVAARLAGTATVNLLPLYAGEEVHVWATFTDEGATEACNSKYMGSVTLT
ncbi:DUF6266 family protein [Niabella pedocola]|uniref:DUF6266 family protein n=1 Tax=Niabella pedocola TaxID=1752077 RepID=A0ABS8PQC8_9BACT|nr:DUF6266 family protein [Niabella pedocola]MCD2423300.1 DUF6266 family protein [Niabella pedocola]